MGVVRGGLIPVTILSHKLSIPLIRTIDPRAWVHDGRHYDLNGTAVVDDICDTGETFRQIREFFPRALLVTPYLKPAGRSICDLSVIEVLHHVWVVMPWEVE